MKNFHFLNSQEIKKAIFCVLSTFLAGCVSSLDGDELPVVREVWNVLDEYAAGLEPAKVEEVACELALGSDLSDVRGEGSGYSISSRQVTKGARIEGPVLLWDLRRRENFFWERVLHVEVNSNGDCGAWVRLYGP